MLFLSLAGDALGQEPSLGYSLFFDHEISSNQDTSCASCHKPERYFSDGNTIAHIESKKRGGIEKLGFRHTPKIADMGRRTWFSWDGRAPSLEIQIQNAIENPSEHGFTRTGIAWVISTNYRTQWRKAFGPFPKNVAQWLNGKQLDEIQALPRRITYPVPDPLLREAISTIRDSDFLRMVFGEAQKRSVLMQSALMRLYEEDAVAAETKNNTWNRRWEGMNDDLKISFNEVFTKSSSAIALFVKTIETGPPKPKLDFSASEQRGLNLFRGKAACANCHRGRDFTDDQFHNIGLPAPQPFTNKNLPDMGRAFAVGIYTNSAQQAQNICWNLDTQACREAKFLNVYATETTGAFKTPSLHNVAHTSPYMHDGSLKTLDDVLAFYNDLPPLAVVGKRSGLLRSLGFTSQELNDLKAFLGTLSTGVQFDDGGTIHVVP